MRQGATPPYHSVMVSESVSQRPLCRDSCQLTIVHDSLAERRSGCGSGMNTLAKSRGEFSNVIENVSLPCASHTMP